MIIKNRLMSKTALLVLAASAYVLVAQADVNVAHSLKQAKSDVHSQTRGQEKLSQATKAAQDYRSPGKASAPLQFVDVARFRGSSGDVVRVEVSARATSDIDSITVQVNPEKGLVLAQASDRQMSIGAVNAGQVIPLTFDVVAMSEGLTYVNVIYQLNTQHGTRMTSYSVPVEIGNIKKLTSTRSKANIVVDKDGTVMHVMDARKHDSRSK